MAMSLSPRYLLVQLADGTDIGKLVETLISNGHSRLSLFDNLPGRFDELYGLALGEGNQCPISLFPVNPAHVSNRAVESDCLESKENEATIGNTDGDDLDSTLCHKSDHIHDITLLEDIMKDTEKNTQLLEGIKRDDEELQEKQSMKTDVSNSIRDRSYQSDFELSSKFILKPDITEDVNIVSSEMCTNQKEPEKEESKVVVSDINSNVISEFDATQASVQTDDIDTHEIDKNLGNEASLCTFSDSNEEVQPKDYLYHDCQLCSRRLKFREGWGKTRLWDHVRRHLGVKAAKCGWCSYAEVTSDYVRRHSLKEHPKMKVVYIDTSSVDDRLQLRMLWLRCFPKFPNGVEQRKRRRNNLPKIFQSLVPKKISWEKR